MNEEIDYLNEEEFKQLPEKEKWKLIENLKKMIKDLKIQADKNCEECEKNLLTAEDINIDLFFQDWRSCAEHCDECSEEERKNMCETQLNLMNHIANTLLELQRKQNVIAQLVLKKDTTGSELLNKFMKEKEELDKKTKRSDDLYR
jgi:hypothetical protein